MPKGVKMEKYRPKIHFSAEDYIINDPNGLVDYKGEYHLFHQYNINEQIYWGHAVSKDLVHWKRLPKAIAPDKIGQIWSGSAVVDEENQRMVAFFTYSEHETKRQSQGVAFSYDKGRTWEKYSGNPILTDSREDFRDPKVFRYEEKCVMILSGGDCVLLYESKDLIHWNQISSFKGNQESHTGVWECPDLFPMIVETTEEKKWVLTVSVNDGSPAGGTGMQYFVGEFDGQKFIADLKQEKGLWIDYGKDFYAGVTWNHVPKDRRLMIAWADNWQYRDYLPTSPFKGQMSCVRELKLVQKEKKYILKQLPVKEMECLRTNKHEMKNIKMGADEEWTLCDKKEVLELDISYPIEKIHAQTFGIKISTGKNRQFEIVFCKEKQCCFVDRTTAGVNPHDKISPALSTTIIISHVKDGVELAKEYDVPTIVTDMIAQHHGTTLVKYFYYTLKNNSENPDLIKEDDFRYPGPKPQTKEAAIIMMADSVEAAVRSIQEPTLDKIEAMVNNIIKDKLNSNQLNECDLTFKDLEVIKACFLKVLKGIYHHRIEYPTEKIK